MQESFNSKEMNVLENIQLQIIIHKFITNA